MGFHNTTATMSIGNYYASFSMFDNTNRGYAGAAQIYKLIDKRLYDAIPETDYRKKYSMAVRKQITPLMVPKRITRHM